VDAIKKLSTDDMVKFYETYIIPKRLLLDDKKKKESKRSALVMIAIKSPETNITNALKEMEYEIIDDLAKFKGDLIRKLTSKGGSS
jgi:hypothetical protein